MSRAFPVRRFAFSIQLSPVKPPTERSSWDSRSSIHSCASLCKTSHKEAGSDVDLSNGGVTINQAVEQTAAGLRYKAPKTENSEGRRIKLPAITVRALNARQASEFMRLGLGTPELVFTRENGSAVKPDTFLHSLHCSCAKSRVATDLIPWPSPHTLYGLAQGGSSCQRRRRPPRAKLGEDDIGRLRARATGPGRRRRQAG